MDPYVDPDSGVLRNRLGISDPERLRQVEAGLTLAALADLGTRTLPGAYDLTHLQTFHREIFGDLYPLAGEIRVVGIARSDPFRRSQRAEGAGDRADGRQRLVSRQSCPSHGRSSARTWTSP